MASGQATYAAQMHFCLPCVQAVGSFEHVHNKWNTSHLPVWKGGPKTKVNEISHVKEHSGSMQLLIFSMYAFLSNDVDLFCYLIVCSGTSRDTGHSCL